MMEIGAVEAKSKLGTLLDRVEQGEEIIITRHGKPVARLVPNTKRIDTLQVDAAIERIRVRARSLKSGIDWAALKTDRDTGGHEFSSRQLGRLSLGLRRRSYRCYSTCIRPSPRRRHLGSEPMEA